MMHALFSVLLLHVGIISFSILVTSSLRRHIPEHILLTPMSLELILDMSRVPLYQIDDPSKQNASSLINFSQIIRGELLVVIIQNSNDLPDEALFDPGRVK